MFRSLTKMIKNRQDMVDNVSRPPLKTIFHRMCVGVFMNQSVLQFYRVIKKRLKCNNVDLLRIDKNMFACSFMKLKLIYTFHIFDYVVSTTNKFVFNYVDEN